MNYHQYKQARQLIIEDCQRYENYKGFSSVLKRFLLYPAFKVLVFHRLLTSFGLVGGAFSFFYRHMALRYSIDIPLTVKIAGGLSMPHGGPIVINQKAIIGRNCSIHPCTLIGGVRGKGAPVIGDKVFIGHGAKVLGNVHVADYTFICPNTVVVKDTEEGTTLTGIPARLLDRKGKEHCQIQMGVD